jgi:hypothetical protein
MTALVMSRRAALSRRASARTLPSKGVKISRLARRSGHDGRNNTALVPWIARRTPLTRRPTLNHKPVEIPNPIALHRTARLVAGRG